VRPFGLSEGDLVVQAAVDSSSVRLLITSPSRLSLVSLIRKKASLIQHAVDIMEKCRFRLHGLGLAPPEMLPLRRPSHLPRYIVGDKAFLGSFRGVLYIQETFSW